MAIHQHEAIRELVAWCRQQRDQTRESLEWFESGRMHIGTQGPAQLMKDESIEHMARLREIISRMDALIAKYGEL
jgi:hypothetical protein